MPIARVQMPDGRIGRFEVPEGTSPAEVESLAEQVADLGEDPNTGKFDESLLGIDMAMRGVDRGSDRERPYRATLPFLGGHGFNVGGPFGSLSRSMANIDDKTSTPIVLGTMGALATGGTSLVPSVLGAGVGGAGGGALAESNQAGATPGSIGGAALRGGATMAATELGGFGIGALANRMIAPNLARYADPLKPVRQRVAEMGIPQYLRGAMSRATQSLPPRVQRLGRFAASPIGGEILEAAAIPAAMALGGPTVAIPLWLARAAISPSVLQRYLSSSKLPSTFTRTLGRRALTTGTSGGLLAEQNR